MDYSGEFYYYDRRGRDTGRMDCIDIPTPETHTTTLYFNITINTEYVQNNSNLNFILN